MSTTTRREPTATAKAAATTCEARSYAAAGASSPLAPATIRRREPGPQDVQIEILFCGICRSDLHTVRNEWSGFMPTTSRAKKADALRLGAHEVILSSDPEEMKAHAGSFDFILDTISADHDINACINMASLKAE